MGVITEHEQVKVGTIPDDWQRTTVRHLASRIPNAIVGGPFGSDLVSRDYVDYGVPVIRGQNMTEQYLSGIFVYVTHAKAKSLEANLAHPGDLIFTQRGTLGQVSLVPGSPYDQYLVSQSQMKLTMNKTIADPLYYYHVFSSSEMLKYIQQSTIQTGVPHINLGILRDIPIPLPPLPEQRAIAAALSDVDALIRALDQLIAKKRALKQATMQQLLTGQHRLPGFTGAWKVTRLGDVIERIVGGGTPSRSNPSYWGSEIPWMTVKDFATFDSRQTQEAITREGLEQSASNLIPKGTLITSTRMALGKAVVYAMDVSINQDLKALFFKRNMSVQYLYYWFQFHVDLIEALGSGSTVMGISVAELRNIEFRLSSLEEQTAIAAALSDMDAEIAALEARRDKTRALKQGMMQELLTGRIRLI